MKITVISGEDTKKSRERFNYIIESIKKRGWEVHHFSKDGGMALPDAISGGSLFSTERLIVLDGIAGISAHELDWIKKNTDKFDSKILIYTDRNLPKKFSDTLPKTVTFEKFDLPKLIFKFLETIYPKNAKNILTDLKKLLADYPMEFVMALLSRQMRDLYWVKVAPETYMAPSWLSQKLKRQSDKFDQQTLVNFIENLAKIDVESKTSSVSASLLLDLAIVSDLQ